MNFKYKLMQFMSGRYGMDKLFYGIFAVAMVLSVINLFLMEWLLQLVIYGLIIYAFFRFFSRNIPARRKENEWFLGKLNFFKQKRDFYKRQKNDTLHIYKKCPYCKAILRLPRRVGTHTTSCPRCNNSFTVKVKK